ncbi:hypothetical protein PoB_001591600 [Plakobranchus ocellatus]|uniref:Uncharacterized protein n=1 Tax=Plakobranchus ocellatus TaxID=259542 RepID=A0AAV3Z4A5_9GAST|nr:hypothetical protein PoB_001591600 [Plakobranchus ocellatus]
MEKTVPSDTSLYITSPAKLLACGLGRNRTGATRHSLSSFLRCYVSATKGFIKIILSETAGWSDTAAAAAAAAGNDDLPSIYFLQLRKVANATSKISDVSQRRSVAGPYFCMLLHGSRCNATRQAGARAAMLPLDAL